MFSRVSYINNSFGGVIGVLSKACVTHKLKYFIAGNTRYVTFLVKLNCIFDKIIYELA